MKKEVYEKIKSILLILLGVVATIFIVFVVVFLVRVTFDYLSEGREKYIEQKEKNCKEQKQEKTPIHNLKLEGDLEEKYYSFYIEMDDKSKKLMMYQIDEIDLFDDTEEDYYFLEKKICKHTLYGFLEYHPIIRELHVPEGSLKEIEEDL